MTSFLDLMYAFAQWLAKTPLAEGAAWLERTSLNHVINSSMWVAPIVQTTHILAIGVTVASVLMVSLRIYSLAGRSRTLEQTAARYLPWLWTALLVLLLTGLILIIGEPPRELVNPFFWSKMALVVVGGALSLAFQEAVRRHAGQWELSSGGTAAMKAGAAAVVVLWLLIIIFGRWIAYAPT